VGLDGAAELTSAPLPAAKSLWKVGLARGRVASDDPWRRLKSTERHLYDVTRAELPEGWDEAVFLNERGELVEGTITSLFLWRDHLLWTPPLASGALPGVLRAKLLATGRAREAVLRWEDITEGRLFLGNALRGLLPAMVI
jgi:4-amino-4-deoxychorismate lyase